MKQFFLVPHGDGRLAAIVTDGHITRLCVDGPDAPARAGEIYRGKVVDVVKKANCAFVDIGWKHNGFLPPEPNAPTPGGSVVVTLTSVSAEPGKGPRLAQGPRIAGTYMILQQGHRAASKDITDQQAALSRLDGILAPDEGGVLRAAAASVPDDILQQELAALRQIRDAALASQGPLLYRPDPIAVFFEEHNAGEIQCEIQADADYIASLGMTPTLRPTGLADRHRLPATLKQIAGPTVWLDCGARLTIETTRAATLIDIDAAKCTQPMAKWLPAAAKGVMDQIALRELSGNILIDFPRNAATQQPIDTLIRATAAQDPTKTTPHGFTSLGFYEIARSRRVAPTPTKS